MAYVVHMICIFNTHMYLFSYLFSIIFLFFFIYLPIFRKLHVIGYLVSFIINIVFTIIKFAWINTLLFSCIYIYKISNTFFYMYYLTRESRIMKTFFGELPFWEDEEGTWYDSSKGGGGVIGRWEFLLRRYSWGFGDYHIDFEENIL